MDSHQLASLYEPLPAELRTSLAGMAYAVPTFHSEPADSLRGFRTALVASHGPELPELHVPTTYLRERGASVEIVTQDWLFDGQTGAATGMLVLAQWLATNVAVRADKRISEARVEDYDALIFIGGAWNPILLRTDGAVLQLIRAAKSRGILICALCHGPQVLINAEAFPKHTRVTGVADIRLDLKNAGFAVEVAPVVYDEAQGLLTSPDPSSESLRAFCEGIGAYARRHLQRGP